jgi:hypothetical protein
MSNTIPLHTVIDAHTGGGSGYSSIIAAIKAALASGQSYTFTDLEGRPAHRFLTIEQFTRWLNYFEGTCFIDALEPVGVCVIGREAVLKGLVSANDWREEFATLARIGAVDGIVLASTAPGKFNEMVPALQELLSRFGFNSKQAFAVQDNVNLSEPE